VEVSAVELNCTLSALSGYHLALQNGFNMKLSIVTFGALLTTLLAPCSFAWEGVETESGNDVEIEKGNLVRFGESIEYYDHSEGEYKSVTVNDINRYGNIIEIEVTDDETGEALTLEMED
jgi:hypothetical protein